MHVSVVVLDFFSGDEQMEVLLQGLTLSLKDAAMEATLSCSGFAKSKLWLQATVTPCLGRPTLVLLLVCFCTICGLPGRHAAN